MSPLHWGRRRSAIQLRKAWVGRSIPQCLYQLSTHPASRSQHSGRASSAAHSTRVSLNAVWIVSMYSLPSQSIANIVTASLCTDSSSGTAAILEGLMQRIEFTLLHKSDVVSDFCQALTSPSIFLWRIAVTDLTGRLLLSTQKAKCVEFA